MPNLRVCLLLFLGLLGAATLHAEDGPSPVETKLREALRNSMLQARDVQNQLVTAQAAQAQSDKDNADLKGKVDALAGQVTAITKQSAAEKAASDATIGQMKTQIADLNDQLKKYSDALEAWKKDDADKTTLAANKEAARAELAGQVIALRRLLEDRELKNIELFKTGNEILTRYENFGLGDALSAKEPFIGLTRVKLQELVQDYRDKLLDHVITNAPVSGGAASSGASTSTSMAPATSSATAATSLGSR